jgi:hypothetical protein
MLNLADCINSLSSGRFEVCVEFSGHLLMIPLRIKPNQIRVIDILHTHRAIPCTEDYDCMQAN